MIGSKPSPASIDAVIAHRRAEPRDAFDQGAEAEGDEQQLHAAIAGQTRERSTDHVEVAAFDRQVVEEHGAEHDPADRPETERHAVGCRGYGQRKRHPPHQPCESERRPAAAIADRQGATRMPASNTASSSGGSAATRAERRTLPPTGLYT
jgi:hypothetical protein